MSAHRRDERAPGRHRSRSVPHHVTQAPEPATNPVPDEDPIALLRENRRDRKDPWWRNLPRPSRGALVGVAVLVLIALAAIHLTSRGTAVPLDTGTDAPTPEVSAPAATPAADPPAPASDGGGEPPGGAPDVPAGPSAPTEVVVHVSGAVKEPGLVHLPTGSRVADALEASGGTTKKADEAALNLARPLTDGEHVHVPEPGEDPPAPDDGSPADAPSSQGPADDPGSDSSASGGTVNLNTADASELEELPGVGPSIARRILDHRELNGPFESVDDLVEVSGIGPATLEKIRPQATV